MGVSPQLLDLAQDAENRHCEIVAELEEAKQALNNAQGGMEIFVASEHYLDMLAISDQELGTNLYDPEGTIPILLKQKRLKNLGYN